MIYRENVINDDELLNVTGGGGKSKASSDSSSENKVKVYCPECNQTTTFIVYSGARGKCTKCGHQMTV